MKSALFWDITERRVILLYRRFGTTYRSHIQRSWTSSSLTMGQIVRPETSVNDYHSTSRNSPEQRRSHQHSGRRLKSRIFSFPVLGFPSIYLLNILSETSATGNPLLLNIHTKILFKSKTGRTCTAKVAHVWL
jgi:hypothetical protein